MSEQTAVRTREKWVDDVKVIACILVVLLFPCAVVLYLSCYTDSFYGKDGCFRLDCCICGKASHFRGGQGYTSYRQFSQTRYGLCSA